MKVALGICPDVFLTKEYTPPLGLTFLATVLRDEGHQIDAVDSMAEKLDVQGFVDRMRKFNPDLIGVQTYTDSRFDSFKLAEELKKELPQVPIVLGGPHPQFTDLDTLKHVPQVDIIARGESEATIVDLAETLEKGKDLRDVRGVTYRDANGHVVKNEERPQIPDLDSIPIPDRDLLPFHKYNPLLETTYDRRATSIMLSRGCPLRCTFCANPAIWRTFRKNSVGRVIEELTYLKDTYGYTAFDLYDDTLNLDKKWLHEVLDAIINEGLDIEWYARARLNLLDNELLDKMKKAGMRAALFGIESGSPRILNVIKKGITIQQVHDGITKCLDRDIAVKAGFMLNHPEETLEDVRMTMDLMKWCRDISEGQNQIKTTPAVTRIYPGTGTIIDAVKNKILEPTFSWSKPFWNIENIRWNASPMTPLYDGIPLKELQDFYIKHALKQGDWFPAANLVWNDLLLFKRAPSAKVVGSITKKLMLSMRYTKPMDYPEIIRESTFLLKRKFFKKNIDSELDEKLHKRAEEFIKQKETTAQEISTGA